MAQTDLAAIATKVRRLTRSPSTTQLSDAELYNYINTFLLYDMPQHIKLFDYRKTLQWYTSAYVDTYSTTAVPTSPLYDFKNKYTLTSQPVYIAGYQVIYSQSRDELFNIYPQIQNLQTVAAGFLPLGSALSGTLTYIPFLQNQVLFSWQTALGSIVQTAQVNDIAITEQQGILVDSLTQTQCGNINYVTGVWSIATLPYDVIAGSTITVQYTPYKPARPLYMCFFDNTFILRPVPDKAYIVNMEVDVIPSELINTTQSPEIKQYWQYIAYGAAKKILQDRMDMETVAMIEPEFREQEMLCQRKTVELLTNTRVPTIFSEMGRWAGAGWWGNGFNNS